MLSGIDLTRGGVRWRLAPQVAGHAPFGADGPPVAEWLAAGLAHVVKHGPHSTVYRVVLPDLDLHLKHYHPADARARLRSLLRPCKARLEGERTAAAAARGVPTLETLAIGESLAGRTGGSYLVTRTVPGVQTLTEFLEAVLPQFDARRQTRVRQRLAVSLGRFLARMHNAGLVHHDLHTNNLLLRLGPDDDLDLYLIDLYATHLGPPLDWPRSRDNLVIIDRWFMLRAGLTDRLRCWAAYRAARDPSRADLPFGRGDGGDALLTRDLGKRTLRSNLDFWRRRDGRCFGGNRWFRRVHSPAVAGCCVADLDAAALAPFLADPDEPFRQPGVKVLKNSPSSTVIEFDLPVAGTVRPVIYKRFAVTRWTDPWAALFRPPSARRSYVMGHGLRLRGLPTPRPLAFFHRRRFGLDHEGYLLTEKAPDASELPTYVADLGRLPRPERRQVLRGLVEQAARLLAALHARRLSHRDLKGANLLVNRTPWFNSYRGATECGPAGSSARPQIWFIDLVGVRRHARLRRARRVQNLARLYASFHGRGLVTRTGLLHFLRVYLGRRAAGGWKEWWRAIERAFGAKVRRNLRNNRPLG